MNYLTGASLLALAKSIYYCQFNYQSNEFEKFEVYIFINTYQFENCIADVGYINKVTQV